MRLTTRWRLLRARTVPATTLLFGFLAGAVAAVPPTLWVAMGRHAPVRSESVSKEGARPYTPALRQSLHELTRAPRSGGGAERIEAFVTGQGQGGTPAVAEGCATPATRVALGRQLAVQRTAAEARLSADPFATRAFDALLRDAPAALACLDSALEHSSAAEPARVEWVRLAARISRAVPAASARAKQLLLREALRSVDATSGVAPAPLYALHGYLDIEPNLTSAGDMVRHALRAQTDPTVRAAMREVVSKRFSGLVTSWVM